MPRPLARAPGDLLTLALATFVAAGCGGVVDASSGAGADSAVAADGAGDEASSPGLGDGGDAAAGADAAPADPDAAPPDAAVDAAPVDLDAAPPDGSPVPDVPTVPGEDVPGPGIDAGAPPDGAAPDAGPSLAEWNRRADVALQSLLLRYWNGGTSDLDATNPAGGRATGYWTYAQALDAVLDGVERTGGARYAGDVRTLIDAQDARGWTRDFFDDENWMALALLRAYQLLGDRAFLDRARALYADIMAHTWDATCCGAHPGGLWWDRAHTQKATAINAGAVITGARLHLATGDATYLAFARRAYDYWLGAMVDPATHQVADHVAASGAVTRWRFTYNEGLMIGAGVELHRVTGEARYLDDARAIAAFMLGHETTHGPAGAVLFDGTDAACHGDCAQFKGIGFRYLALLARADPSRTDYRSLLQTSAESVWSVARSPATGRVSADWSAAPPGASTAGAIEADSSAAMALGVFAMLQGNDFGAALPVGQVEAEEAVLHGVGLEATHRGFQGWGYVAGWSHDGQWVDFVVHAAVAGERALTFRYAAAAGAAGRHLFANGHVVAEDVAFPGTSAWEDYRTVTVRAPLVAGTNTVSLIYGSAHGSHGFLNLDRLVVGP